MKRYWNAPFRAKDFDAAITDEELENLPFRNADIKGKRKDQCRIFADRANAIIAAMLKEAPRVWGPINYTRTGTGEFLYSAWHTAPPELFPELGESARLVCIEPLEKKDE